MIPFTEDIYWSHFAYYQESIWPLPLLIILLGLASLVALRWSGRWAGRGQSAFLAILWLWTGGIYFPFHYGQLVWAGPLFAAAFIAQGLLVAWDGVVKGRLKPAFNKSAAGWAGLVLCALGFVLGPLLAPDWNQSPLFGVTPGPLALYSLGMIVLTKGRVYYRLLPIPLLWSGVDGTTLFMIGHPEGLALPVAGFLALGVGVRRNVI